MNDSIPFNLDSIKKDPGKWKSFLSNLVRLGFPLEFRTRKKLRDKGYLNVRAMSYSLKNKDSSKTKEIDIAAHKQFTVSILSNLKINMNLQLLGECKGSADKERILFAIPVSSELDNNIFIGPLTSKFQNAVYSAYKNTWVAAHFAETFGDLVFATSIRDTNVATLLSEDVTRQKETPDYEKIYEICEVDILPALNVKYPRVKRSGYNDYLRTFGNCERLSDDNIFLRELKNGAYLSFDMLVPFIITTKKLFEPIFNEQGNVVDCREIPFCLYQHSIQDPDKYVDLCVDGNSNLAIFICTEESFDEMMEYIQLMAKKFFDIVTSSLQQNPNLILEDYRDIEMGLAIKDVLE